MRVDGVLATTWTSSGTTSGFETIDLSGVSGRVIDVTGQLADSEWLSITEVRVPSRRFAVSSKALRARRIGGGVG